MSATAPSGSDADERLRKLVHDLSTPATVITGFADLLERGGETMTDDKRAEYVHRISEAARELREILDDYRPDSSSA
jgi:signal transduction histidine kinase